MRGMLSPLHSKHQNYFVIRVQLQFVISAVVSGTDGFRHATPTRKRGLWSGLVVHKIMFLTVLSVSLRLRKLKGAITLPVTFALSSFVGFAGQLILRITLIL